MQTSEKRINRVMSIFGASEGQIRPHFFMTGPTGSGKTFTITRLAEDHNIPVLSVNMAQITNEGIAGNSLSKALSPLVKHQGNPLIVFLDEFDKVISEESSATSGGVQQELLKILEDSTTEVYGDYGKYVRVTTSNVLFVFAGAFNGAPIQSLAELLQHGVIPELLGRVGLHFSASKTPLETVLEMLEKSDLLKEYLATIQGADKKVALKALSTELENQYPNNVIGLRLINSLIHQYFINGGFETVTPTNASKPRNTKDTTPVRDLSFL